MDSDRIRLNSTGSGEGAESVPSPREQLDLLISRLADGEGAPSDWEVFGALAQRTPGAWEQLARAQRDQAALCVAVGVALHAADRVELPSREVAERFAGTGPGGAGSSEAGVERIFVWSRVRTWGGWAAAAVLTLAWMTGGFKPNAGPASVGNVASLVGRSVSTPEEAFKAYLDLGAKDKKVLGEAPQRIVLDRRPTADGKGYEIITVRQVFERLTVTELTDFPATDEAGRAVPRLITAPGTPEAAQ